MELTGVFDCGALEGEEKSERVEEEVASGGSFRVERLVRRREAPGFFQFACGVI
jgi:hypothetical protein